MLKFIRNSVLEHDQVLLLQTQTLFTLEGSLLYNMLKIVHVVYGDHDWLRSRSIILAVHLADEVITTLTGRRKFKLFLRVVRFVGRNFGIVTPGLAVE